VLLKSEEKPGANDISNLNAALAHRSAISIVAIPIARSMEQLYRNNAKRKELHSQPFHPPSSARRRRKASYSTPASCNSSNFQRNFGSGWDRVWAAR